MNNILQEIENEFSTYRDSEGNEIKPRWDLIDGLSLDVGDWIQWCYKDDYDFLKQEKFSDSHIKKHYLGYEGLLIQLPDTEHFRLEGNAILMITKYPIEKSNCVVDYVSLIKFLSNEELKFVVKSK